MSKLRAEGTALKGPVDHSVPVLAVRSPAGQLLAVVCGYACHATTLSFYQWSGDWPGFAQRAVEAKHPEAMALYYAGCGSDQNPLPRRTVAVELPGAYRVQVKVWDGPDGPRWKAEFDDVLAVAERSGRPAWQVAREAERLAEAATTERHPNLTNDGEPA